MNKVAIIIVSLILAMAVGLAGCVTSQQSEFVQPAPVEVSFEIEPNSSHSIPVYLNEGQYLRVHSLLTPTELGREVIRVKYSYPGGGEVCTGLDFDTVPVHGEGYYSIDFHYGSEVEFYDPEIYENVRVYVRYEILPSKPLETSPPSTPQYHTLTFTIPANSDYSSPIYLRNNETLHLMWTVEGGQDKVWFHIITPSMKSFGFYENGDFANGTLQEGFCQGFEAGMTQFSPSDYDWGEGYYTMMIANNLADPLIVKVEYWIES